MCFRQLSVLMASEKLTLISFLSVCLQETKLMMLQKGSAASVRIKYKNLSNLIVSPPIYRMI
jgi:hypothetical protein